MIPVFLLLAFATSDGQDMWIAVLFLAIAWSDQLDGLVARITGQYSRLGTLLDPLADRALILAGALVCFHFELLPQWALLALALRELVTLGLAQHGVRHGVDLQTNMVGRYAIWPVLFAIALALFTDWWVADALLYIGLAISWLATGIYTRIAFTIQREQQVGTDSTPIR